MESDKLNRWLTLGANIGVLIGLIVLIIEVNQAREMNRGETRNEVAAELLGLLRDVATNPQLADLIQRAERGDELEPAEFLQYRSQILSMLRYFENVHYQFRQGLYDEGEYSSQKEAWRKVYASSGAALPIYCDYRNTFSPEFRLEFDSLLTEHRCS